MKVLLWLMPVFAFTQTFTLDEAVRRSVDQYPSVRASMERVNSAAAGVDLARTAYLPQVSAIAQVNRATTNNVYGMLLQQSVISPISGPPVISNRGTNVFGSAAGLLVTWEPFDFGVRKAGIDAADSARRLAAVSADRSKFEVSALTAGAFLAVLHAEQSLRAAEAGVARAKVLHEVVQAQSTAGLRPGADESRARSEVAIAETLVIEAKQALNVARATLAQWLGAPPADTRVTAGALLKAPPTEAIISSAAHPAMKEQSAAIDEVRARKVVLDRSYVPKFAVQGTTYARGTGANPDFTVDGGANGLAPNYYNWGLGFSVSFDVMSYKSLGEKRRIEAARERSEQARLDQVKQDLDADLARAKAVLDGAREAAGKSVVQLDAARATFEQASARYKAGLGTIVEVADAQRLLTQSEIGESLAKLGIWRGLLAVAAAQGDLEPFLRAAREQ